MTTTAAAVDAAPFLRYVPRIQSDWDLYAPGQHWRSVEATLAFFDISGFTTLSERLNLQGRIGAEELTNVLNDVFGAMLDAGYRRGGSLLKFGGDALLMLFTGADHVIQACDAAVEMRAALRAKTPVVTGSGNADLKVSIGIHTGDLDLFNVGSTHKELLVAGPVATIVADVEGAANPGEIAVSEAVAEKLPRGSTKKRDGIGATLKWRVPRTDAEGIVLRRQNSDDLDRYVPAGLRDHLHDGIPEPGHHLATIAFVRWSGVDAMLAREGGEAVGEALDALMSGIQEAAAAEGIVVLSSDVYADGGKLILTAGVPFTHADDEGRMLRTTAAIVELDTPFALQIGVNHGHLFAGDIGSEFRGTYTVMNDSVNVAARFMAKAQPGCVLADPVTLQRSTTAFEVEGPFEMQLKGRHEPALVYDVRQSLGQRAEDDSGEPPFVGRSNEVAKLRSALARGSGALVLRGDTGIGKTRLVTEALGRFDGSILEVRGEPHSVGTPYGAFAGPLRELLGLTARSRPSRVVDRVRGLAPSQAALAPLLGDVLQIDVPATSGSDAIERRFRMQRTAGLVASLLNALDDPPAFVWLDDVHWMDAASLDLAYRLATRTGDWLSVLSARSEFTVDPPPDAITLDLQPLADDESGELVERLTSQSPLLPQTIREAVRRSAGNPFYLQEMIRLALAGADLDAIPQSLDATVGAQIDRLPARARQLTHFASVLGTSFESSTLVDVLSRVGISVRPAEMVAGALGAIFERSGRGRLGYRHAVVRQVAYEALSFGRRAELHREAAAVLTEATEAPESIAAELAGHHAAAGEAGKAWTYGWIGADRARDQFANIEAVRLYRLALDAADDVRADDRFDVWISLGDVYEQSGRFEESRDAYKSAERLEVAPTKVAHARYRRALAEMRQGSYVAGLRSTTRGLRALDGVDSRDAVRERALLTSLRAAIRMSQWKVDDAAAEATEALAHAQAAEDIDAESRARLVLHAASLGLGSEEGKAHGLRALELSHRLRDLDGVAHVANNLGAEAYFEDRWDEAVARYREAEDAFTRAGNDVGAAVSQANVGEVLVDQRRFDEACPMLHAAVRVLSASSDASERLIAEVLLARCLVGQGSLDEGIDRLSETFEAAIDTDQAIGVMTAGEHLALALADAGRGEEAMAVVDRYAKELGEDMAPTSAARVQALVAAHAGSQPEAVSIIESALVMEETSTFTEALLIELGARMGRKPSDPERDRAARTFERLGVVGSGLSGAE